MKPTFSLCIHHTPWRPERVAALRAMLDQLLPLSRRVPFLLHDADYRHLDWQHGKVAWALAGWEWSLAQPVTHHLIATDDLHLAPGFWGALEAMVEACPGRPIGLLANHPGALELLQEGRRWYATNSWLVGPAYVLPHAFLEGFLRYFLALPDGDWRTPGTRAYRNDDSSINEYVTNGGGGGRTLHPVPTIIEHRGDLDSTVGHGDQYSRERVSWREVRHVEWLGDHSGRFAWRDETYVPALGEHELADVRTWRSNGGPEAAPMLPVGG